MSISNYVSNEWCASAKLW